ncbi:MAG: hypothetical protein GXY33_20560 [Phycisphaerae bacterium]|nr:hypothetical protein [Phycisphaerae bacterium]
MNPTVILANVLGVAGLLVALRFLVWPGRIPAGLESMPEVVRRFRRLLLRRRINAALMAATALLFLVGMNFFDRLSHRANAAIWMAILSLLAIVFILALLDLSTLRRIRLILQSQLDDRIKSLFQQRREGEDQDHADP